MCLGNILYVTAIHCMWLYVWPISRDFVLVYMNRSKLFESPNNKIVNSNKARGSLICWSVCSCNHWPHLFWFILFNLLIFVLFLKNDVIIVSGMFYNIYSQYFLPWSLYTCKPPFTHVHSMHHIIKLLPHNIEWRAYICQYFTKWTHIPCDQIFLKL